MRKNRVSGENRRLPKTDQDRTLSFLEKLPRASVIILQPGFIFRVVLPINPTLNVLHMLLKSGFPSYIQQGSLSYRHQAFQLPNIFLGSSNRHDGAKTSGVKLVSMILKTIIIVNEIKNINEIFIWIET